MQGRQRWIMLVHNCSRLTLTVSDAEHQSGGWAGVVQICQCSKHNDSLCHLYCHVLGKPFWYESNIIWKKKSGPLLQGMCELSVPEIWDIWDEFIHPIPWCTGSGLGGITCLLSATFSISDCLCVDNTTVLAYHCMFPKLSLSGCASHLTIMSMLRVDKRTADLNSVVCCARQHHGQQ